jgi:apolipoprotein N-acyltransferase
LAAVFGPRFYRNYERAVGAYLWLAAASFIGGFGWWGATIAGGSPVAEMVFLAVQALFGPLSFAVDRWVVRRFGRNGDAPFWTSPAFPLTATASVFIMVGQSPVGTFGADAYSQYGWPPVMQLAAVTGLWGFTFLMAWFASVVNYAWEVGFEWRRCARGVALCGAGEIGLTHTNTAGSATPSPAVAGPRNCR